MADKPFDLHGLFRRIASRRDGDPQQSWTARLMRDGTKAIGAKILEEAAEVVAAARGQDPRGQDPSNPQQQIAEVQQQIAEAPQQIAEAPQQIAEVQQQIAEARQQIAEAQQRLQQRIAEESADLIYHLLVLLAYHGVDIADVEKILAKRQGQSGLAEKAARGNKKTGI